MSPGNLKSFIVSFGVTATSYLFLNFLIPKNNNTKRIPKKALFQKTNLMFCLTESIKPLNVKGFFFGGGGLMSISWPGASLSNSLNGPASAIGCPVSVLGLTGY